MIPYFESSDLDEIEGTLNKERRKLNIWLNVNRPALNVSKTSLLLFPPVNKPLINVTILINKQAISQKNYVKYLDVLVSWCLDVLMS